MNFSRAIKIFLIVLLGLVLINLGFLNYKVLFGKKPPAIISPQISSDKPPVVEEEPPVPTPTEIEEGTCPPACLAKIAQVTAEISDKAEKEPVSRTAQIGVKEFYIPLGSGSTTNRDWEELAGVEAVIDSANFSQVNSIIFEAVLRIPSANGMVYAKLYDLTNKHDLWFSEVSAEGSTSYRAESKQISLSPGRNLYRVKMKSTMGYQAFLDSARIKIILK